ncbi:multidrug effflux MFS transporter [Streptomyces sp. NPDC101234]|uniref:multidrug effflux MFS transporter n=1 Tax=Streptomyces sp. NPDC101234 TaxID=3366138 RepID=UPI00380ED186
MTLSLLAVLGPLTTDLYLPAFPRMAADLGASAAQIQWSLSATLLGVAAGQLLFGPLSDAVGRRWPLMSATGIHVAASAAIALVGSAEWLLVWRFLQGLGAAGVSVVATAVARDAFEGRRLVRVLARLALLSGLAPVVAPLLGSLLLWAAGWRGVFAALAGYGLVAVVLCFAVLPETLTGGGSGPRDRSSVKHRYRAVLTDRGLTGASVIGATMVGGVFAYLSTSSFAFQTTYGLGADAYALLFAVNASAFAVGSQVAARALTRFSPQRVLRWALSAALTAAAATGLTSLLALGVVGFTVALFLFLLAAGACMPTVQVVALQRHGRQAGTAASVLGFVNFGFASLVSPLSGTGPDRVLALGVVLGGLSCVALVSLRVLVTPAVRSHEPTSSSVPAPDCEEARGCE